jgi:hypothetical protein
MKTVLRSASATLAASLAGGSLGAIVLMASAPVPAAAACDPATRAIQYLVSKQMADGSIDGSLGETSDFVLGAAADGIDPNTLKAASGKSPYDFVLADLGTASPKSFSDANQLGKVIQGVVAGGHDPSNYGGQNLLARILSASGPGALYNSGTGAFQDGNGGAFQGFAQAQALLGLEAAGNAGYPVPATAVTELKSLRSTSGATKGGWQVFGSFDSNTTSMALMALVGAGDTPSNDSSVFTDAFTFLHTQQDAATGGFTYSTDFGTTSDPDSDALVMQALTAAGQDPGGTAWTNAKGRAPSDILTFQDASSGGFAFSIGGKLQAFATSQVPAGILQAAFPIKSGYKSGATVPAAGCPAAAAVVAAVSPSPAPPSLPRAGRPAPVGPSTDGAWLVSLYAGLGALVGAALVPMARRRTELSR